MKHLNYILLLLLPILLGSCRTSAPAYNYQELAKASIRLGIDIDMEDNHALYVESSNWLGVPYRGGGNSKRGVDCSGLTSAIYKKVYQKNLERNSDDQRKKDCRKVKKGKLKEGDLVFFHNGRKKKRATHVGTGTIRFRCTTATTATGQTTARIWPMSSCSTTFPTAIRTPLRVPLRNLTGTGANIPAAICCIISTSTTAALCMNRPTSGR